jgi:acetolactate synthase-1/2/3 large subunit
MLGHGFHPLKARRSRSIPNLQDVHRQGRTPIPDHDWAGFARALGAQGLTVEDPAALGATFGKALAANTTVLIDVKADKNCPTPVYDFSAGARAWSYHE